MGKSVQDLALIMKSLFGKFIHIDNETSPIPFNSKTYLEGAQKKLRIGYILDHNNCETFPGNRNTIIEVVNKLREMGHDVVEITDEWTETFMNTGLKIMLPHGFGTNFLKTLDDEAYVKPFRLQMWLGSLPEFFRRFCGFMSKFVGESRFGTLLATAIKRDINRFYLDVWEKELLKEAYVDSWHKLKLDAMISPVLPFPAIKHGESEMLAGFVGSTFLNNIVGMPAGVVPIRTIKQDEEVYTTKYSDMASRILKKTARCTKGLPVGVQVATMTYNDELCLSLMKQIEDAFNFHEFPNIEESVVL